MKKKTKRNKPDKFKLIEKELRSSVGFFHMKPTLKRWVKEHAKLNHCSLNDVVEEILVKHFKSHRV